jgi:hypothetical protein
MAAEFFVNIESTSDAKAIVISVAARDVARDAGREG